MRHWKLGLGVLGLATCLAAPALSQDYVRLSFGTRASDGQVSVNAGYVGPRFSFIQDPVVGWPDGEKGRAGMAALTLTGIVARRKAISVGEQVFPIGRHDGASVVLVYLREHSPPAKNPGKPRLESAALIVPADEAPLYRTSASAARGADGQVEVTVSRGSPTSVFVRDPVVGWPPGQTPLEGAIALTVDVGAGLSRAISSTRETFDIGPHAGADIIVLYMRAVRRDGTPLFEGKPIPTAAAFIRAAGQ